MCCLNLLSLFIQVVLIPVHLVVVSKACCFQQGCIWAQGRSCSGRLRDQGWRLWAPGARIIFLLHVHITPTIRRVDYGLRMWGTTVRLIWTEEDKHATTVGRGSGNHNYHKNIFDCKRKFCSCSPISPLESPTRKEKMRGEKIIRRGRGKKDWDGLHTFNLSQYNTSF